MYQVNFDEKNRRASLALVTALWHELMTEWHPEAGDPLLAPMRQRNHQDALSTYLKSAAWPDLTPEQIRRPCGFEIVLRLASGRIDTKQSTGTFFAHAGNARWFVRTMTAGDRTASPVNAVALTPEAIAFWRGLDAEGREQALGEARRLLESDLASKGIPVHLLPHRDADAGARSPAASASLDAAASRPHYLRALVEAIAEQPFQPMYRKKASGTPVTGWDARLSAYFWPAPAHGYRATDLAMQAIATTARALADALRERGAWSDDEGQRAVDLAHDIFAWGGVPQDRQTVTAQSVAAVFRAALDNDREAVAHMNSGWTKVAAFATGHLEEIDAGQPHAIWDSRVAAAITSRLDRLLPPGASPATLFPDIGTVPGRGGTRPRALSRAWPSAYRTWPGQVAGSQIVREIRDLLNGPAYPAMPLPDGSRGKWTTRGVEMVLFMDGY